MTLTPRGGRLVDWVGACENADKTCVLTLETDTRVQAVFLVDVTPPPPRPPPVHTDPLEDALGRLRPASVAFNTPTTLRLGESAEIQLLLSIREPLARLKKQIAEIGEVEGAKVDGERRARTVQTFERTLVIDVPWTSRVSGFVDDNWQWLWSAILVPVGLWVLQRRRRTRSVRARVGRAGSRLNGRMRSGTADDGQARSTARSDGGVSTRASIPPRRARRSA